MRDLQKTESRREFLKDGVRTALFGSLILIGASLGWRKISNTGQSSSLVNLPCGDCSILPVCFLPKATDFKRTKRHSSQYSSPRKKGVNSDK